MASPLPTAKQSVDLASRGAAPGASGSRIRRDPPPAVKELVVISRDERDTRTVVIGVLTFVLALSAIAIGVGKYAGWSPREYTVHVEM